MSRSSTSGRWTRNPFALDPNAPIFVPKNPVLQLNNHTSVNQSTLIADESSQSNHLAELNHQTPPNYITQTNHVIQANHVAQANYSSQSNHVAEVTHQPQANHITHQPQTNHITQPNHQTQPNHITQTNHQTQPNYITQTNHQTQANHVDDAVLLINGILLQLPIVRLALTNQGKIYGGVLRQLILLAENHNQTLAEKQHFLVTYLLAKDIDIVMPLFTFNSFLTELKSISSAYREGANPIINKNEYPGRGVNSISLLYQEHGLSYDMSFQDRIIKRSDLSVNSLALTITGTTCHVFSLSKQLTLAEITADIKAQRLRLCRNYKLNDQALKMMLRCGRMFKDGWRPQTDKDKSKIMIHFDRASRLITQINSCGFFRYCKTGQLINLTGRHLICSEVNGLMNYCDPDLNLLGAPDYQRGRRYLALIFSDLETWKRATPANNIVAVEESLKLAAEVGFLAVIQIIKDKCPVPIAATERQKALILALYHGQIETAKYLIQNKVTLPTEDYFQQINLNQSCWHGKDQIPRPCQLKSESDKIVSINQIYHQIVQALTSQFDMFSVAKHIK